DPFVAAGGFDFVRHLGAEMPMRVVSEMLGIPEAGQARGRDRIDAGVRIDEEGASPGFEPVAALSDRMQFSDYHILRPRHPADALMTDLVSLTFVDDQGVERGLDEDEIVNYTTLLAAAGNETTTRLIGWAGYLLGNHPEQREVLLADRTLVPNAIEEILRYEAPSPVQARFVTHDVELHGTMVPEGSIMLLLTAAANRDERAFENPDRFDVRRKIDHHVSFGYGLHFCLGAALARLEGRVALEEVLKRFPRWVVDEQHAERARTSTVRGWDRLPVHS